MSKANCGRVKTFATVTFYRSAQLILRLSEVAVGPLLIKYIQFDSMYAHLNLGLTTHVKV